MSKIIDHVVGTVIGMRMYMRAKIDRFLWRTGITEYNKDLMEAEMDMMWRFHEWEKAGA